MKKVLLTAIAVLGFMTSQAQEVKFGAKLGANLSTASVSASGAQGAIISVPDNKSLFGFHVGGFAEIGLSDKFAFQPELLFSLEGSKYESNSSGSEFGVTYTENSDTKIKMTYINVPLLAKYYATEQLFFAAGPQVGFLMSAKQDSDYTFSSTFNGETETDSESVSGVDVKDSFKSINFSASFGAGYFFTENVFAEVRYNVGLSNIAEDVSYDDGFGTTYTVKQEAKLNNFQISLGYRF